MAPSPLISQPAIIEENTVEATASADEAVSEVPEVTEITQPLISSESTSPPPPLPTVSVPTENEERKEKTQETDMEILAPKTQEKPPEATEAMEPEVLEVQGSIPEEVVEVPKVSEVTVVPTEENMTVESSNIQSDL